MSEEEKTVKKIKPKGETNPRKVKFTTDPGGIRSDLRNGGLKAASRIKGSKEKLDKFLEDLRTLAEHAKALQAKDAERIGKNKVDYAAARARIAEQRAAAAEARAKELEDAAERVRKQAGIAEVE